METLLESQIAIAQKSRIQRLARADPVVKKLLAKTEALDRKVSDMEAAVATAEASAATATGLIDKLPPKQKEAAEKIATLSDELAATQDALKDAMAATVVSAAELAKADIAREAADLEIATLRKQAEELKERIRQNEQGLASLADENSGIKKLNDELEAELAKARAELAAIPGTRALLEENRRLKAVGVPEPVSQDADDLISPAE